MSSLSCRSLSVAGCKFDEVVQIAGELDSSECFNLPLATSDSFESAMALISSMQRMTGSGPFTGTRTGAPPAIVNGGFNLDLLLDDSTRGIQATILGCAFGVSF